MSKGAKERRQTSQQWPWSALSQGARAFRIRICETCAGGGHVSNFLVRAFGSGSARMKVKVRAR